MDKAGGLVSPAHPSALRGSRGAGSSPAPLSTGPSEVSRVGSLRTGIRTRAGGSVFAEQKPAWGTGLRLLSVSQTSCGLQAGDPDPESTERHRCRPPRVTVGFPRRDPCVRPRGEAHGHRGGGSAALPPRCRGSPSPHG